MGNIIQIASHMYGSYEVPLIRFALWECELSPKVHSIYLPNLRPTPSQTPFGRDKHKALTRKTLHPQSLNKAPRS